MLTAIRSTIASWFVKILFGVLIASFAVWGIGDIFRGGSGADSDAAEVGDVTVTRQALERSFRRELARMQRVFGDKFDRDQARAFGGLDRALDQLVVQALFGLEQNRLGMAVSDSRVRAWIANQAQFKDQLGQFDRLRFESVLRQSGLTESGFVAQLRQDLAGEQIVNAVLSGARAPAAQVRAVRAYRQEARIADTVLVSSEAHIVAEPEPSAIQKYYQDNPERFTAPELRDITYVPIRSDEITKEINVSEDDIKSSYENRMQEFTVEERRTIEQIRFADEADARRAKTLLDQGRSFAQVAKEVAGATDTAGLSLGSLTRSEFPLPGAADTVFALAQGAISAPYLSPLGTHIFRVSKIEPGHVIGLAEAREKLSVEIALERALDVMFELANKLEDELAGGASLEESAARLSLTASKVRGLNRTGKLEDGTSPVPIVAAPEFLTAGFATARGEESQLGETVDGSFFILRVDSVVTPALRPLDKVRKAVTTAVIAEAREAASEKVAAGIVEAVKGGRGLAAAASERGLKLKTSRTFTRDGRTDGFALPAPLVAEMFKASYGGLAMAPTAQGFMVGQLKEIRAASPTTDTSAKDKLAEALDQAVRDDILAQFTAALRNRYPVSINQATLDSLFR